jgi:hypothetical protein
LLLGDGRLIVMGKHEKKGDPETPAQKAVRRKAERIAEARESGDEKMEREDVRKTKYGELKGDGRPGGLVY